MRYLKTLWVLAASVVLTMFLGLAGCGDNYRDRDRDRYEHRDGDRHDDRGGDFGHERGER